MNARKQLRIYVIRLLFISTEMVKGLMRCLVVGKSDYMIVYGCTPEDMSCCKYSVHGIMYNCVVISASPNSYMLCSSVRVLCNNFKIAVQSFGPTLTSDSLNFYFVSLSVCSVLFAGGQQLGIINASRWSAEK